jgi:hypothetical protein
MRHLANTSKNIPLLVGIYLRYNNIGDMGLKHLADASLNWP